MPFPPSPAARVRRWCRVDRRGSCCHRKLAQQFDLFVRRGLNRTDLVTSQIVDTDCAALADLSRAAQKLAGVGEAAIERRRQIGRSELRFGCLLNHADALA